MADITKCPGYKCPWRLNCQRFTAQADPLNQSWFIEMPGYYRTEGSGGKHEYDAVWECDHFLPHRNSGNLANPTEK